MSEDNYENILTPTGELILKDKNLKFIEKSMFDKYSLKILHLDLRDNHISHLENNVISILTHLRSLDLRNNKLEILTEKISCLDHLRVLKLDHNLLTVLPQELFKLPLKSLTLSDNSLFCLPSQIGDLYQLESLSIAENHIKSLPPELGHLPILKILHLHGNEFSSLPSSLSCLTNLEELSLEWFRYLIPSSTKLIKGHIGYPIISKLREFLADNPKDSLTLSEFLTEFSEPGFEINKLDIRQRTLAHLAAATGDIGVLNGLIEAGCNINQIDVLGFSPLMIALKEDNVQAAKVLVQAGAEFDIGGGVFGSVLNLAVLKSEPWLVSTILKASKVMNYDNDGNSCLHHLMSVYKKHKHRNKIIADLIVETGIDKNHLNNEGWSALHIAARKGQTSAFRWVQEKNVQLRAAGLEVFDLNIQGGKNAWSPLHLASHSGHYKVVVALVEAGAEVYLRTLDGKTAKDTAKGDLSIFKYLSRAEKLHISLLIKQESLNKISYSSYSQGLESEYKNLYGHFASKNNIGIEAVIRFASQNSVKCDAVYLLGQLKQKKALKALVSCAGKEEGMIRNEAVQALNTLQGVEQVMHQNGHNLIGPRLPRTSPLQMSVPVAVSSYFEEETRTETVLML